MQLIAKMRHSHGSWLTALAGFLLAAPTTVEAQTTKWISNVQIDDLEPAMGGWVWVRLKSGPISCADVGGPASAHLHLKAIPPLTVEAGAFDRVYSTLLTALASNRILDIKVTGSSDGVFCLIERIKIQS